MAGAGLGGLCLAQGLLRAGADVTVYEREASLATRRQGYRLHLDARAGLALAAALPPESFARFQATCAQPSRHLTVATERLRVRREQVAADRGADPYAPATLSTSVDAAVAASRQTGARRNRVMFWLYRRLARS